MAAFVGFDVGNSRVKAGVQSNGNWIHFDHAPASDEPAIAKLVERCRASAPSAAAVISTVNPSASSYLETELAAQRIPIELVLRSDGGIFHTGLVQAALETPETTGVDRVLGVVAALAQSADQPVLVVDCGSAVTVNLASAARMFLGGAILPGPRLMAAALAAGTAALPVVEFDRPPAALGRSTRTAIQAGIYAAVTGGIDRLLDELPRQAALAGTAAVYLTGGSAAFLGPGLRHAGRLDEHLVLHGLFEVARSQMEPP